MRGPALGVLEITTIARGVVAADAGLKRAPAVLLHSRPRPPRPTSWSGSK
jgi:microcompartment protein CcmL/EutN